MSVELQYNEVLRLIRLIRATLSINYVDDHQKRESFSMILNSIGKEADSRQIDGRMQDDLIEKLQGILNYLYNVHA